MKSQTSSTIKKIGWAEIDLSIESLKNLNELILYSDSISQNKKNVSFNNELFVKFISKYKNLLP